MNTMANNATRKSPSVTGKSHQPQPLSTTCENCATAKVKCTRTGDASVCHRCARLGKECKYRQARRRFYGNKTDKRLEMLEARFNTYMEMYPPINPARQTASSPSTSGTQDSQPMASLAPPSSDLIHRNSHARELYTHEPVDGDVIDPVEQGILSLEEAEICFSVFTTTMIYHFPFVMPGPHQSADTLRKQQPFLFIAIMTVASYNNMPLQRRLGHIMNHQINQRLISKGEVSFDLLQGILVYTAWSQYHPRPRRYSQLLALATSIMVDLRLDRPPESWSWLNGVVFNPDSFGKPVTGLLSARKDRKRCVIGLHYLASTSSMVQRKMNTFPYSSHTETYAQQLYLEPEYSTDRYLVYILKITQIWEQVCALPIKLGSDLQNRSSALRMRITMLRKELEMFHDTLPFPMDELHTIELTWQTAHLHLDQIGLLARSHTPQTSTMPTTPWYTEFLCSGLLTCSSFFRKYLASPTELSKIMNNSEIQQVGLFLIIMPKLVVATMEHRAEAPEAAAVLEDINAEDGLNRAVQRIESLVTTEVDDEGDRDVFYQWAKRVRGVREWYARLPFSQQQVPGMLQTGQSGQDLTLVHEGMQVHPDQYLASMGAMGMTSSVTDPDLEQMMADWFAYPMQTFESWS